MNKHVSILIAVIAILLNSCSNGQIKNSETSLSAAAFETKLKSTSNPQLVDVRTPDEYSKGHLINSVNIDWNGNNFDTEINKFDKSKPIFVYCLSGGRSSAAASNMREEGFKEVYEMEGGIMKWRAANLPETTNNTNTSTGINKKQFDELINSDKIVLVDFYADWCVPCKKMKPYLDEISNDMKDKVIVVRINADDNQQLCKDLNINGLPVLQVYKNKILTWTNTGYIEKENVLKNL